MKRGIIAIILLFSVSSVAQQKNPPKQVAHKDMTDDQLIMERLRGQVLQLQLQLSDADASMEQERRSYKATIDGLQKEAEKCEKKPKSE